jgi:hypothetical protein
MDEGTLMTAACQHHDAHPQPLPVLAHQPMAYAGCCLALSAPLVSYLASLLPSSPALTLSVGSGFGLLEAHLIASSRPLNIVGVEVAPSPNKHLPAANHRVVHGTRFLEPLAATATTWLFVYPRRVGLVSEYLLHHGQGSVQKIIWIGPQADWDEYKACFVGWDVQMQSADNVGGRAWDLIHIATKVS